MEFTNEEKFLLQKKLQFLNEIGYETVDRKDSLDYENNDIIITIHNNHFSDSAGILIRFIKKSDGNWSHEVYNISWFIYYFNNCVFLKYNEGMDIILMSIDFLKKHYSEIIDIQWCRNVMNIVDGDLDSKFGNSENRGNRGYHRMSLK